MKHRHFTKWLLGLVTLIALTVLAACGSGQTTRYFQQINQSSKVAVNLTYYCKGDEVTKQSTENIVSYSALNVSNEEEAKKIVEEESKAYKNLKGVKYSVSYSEDRVDEKIEIDFTKVDFKELAKVDSTFSSNVGNAKKISMKASEKLLEKSNFKEVKDGKFEALK